MVDTFLATGRRRVARHWVGELVEFGDGRKSIFWSVDSVAVAISTVFSGVFGGYGYGNGLATDNFVPIRRYSQSTNLYIAVRFLIF